MNTVTITIKDIDDDNVDISFDAENKESTPAVRLAADLAKMLEDYVAVLNTVEDDHATVET